MDGYEDLVKSRAWAKLRRAQIATYDLRQILGAPEFRGIFALADQARFALTDVENALRRLFKDAGRL